jgi:LPXTG-site transpeptidase (sortase) family protein
MEGVMDGRLVLNRPASISVAPRDNSVLYIDHNHNSQEPATNNAGTMPIPVVPETVIKQPQFSQLTPIYQQTPTNSPADIVQPKVKGIEFVAKPAAPTVAPTKPSMTNIVADKSVDLPLPPVVSHEPIAPKLEYLERYLDQAQVTPSNAVFGANPASDNPQVDYMRQYFQQNIAEAPVKNNIAGIIPKIDLSNINKKSIIRASLSLLLVGIIGLGGYVIADSFFINQKAKEVLTQSSSDPIPIESPIVNDSENNTVATTTNATTTTVNATEDQQVLGTADTAAAYAVPADQPKYITISKLGIQAPVVNLGLTSSGAVDTPKNIWHAGWYNGSAKPGTNGASLIDGHSSETHGALFGNLEQLVAGDKIQIERGDGVIINYQVAYVVIVNRNNVDMASMMKPYGNSSKGLNIISCNGKWIDSEKTLENRVLVYAQQI